MRPRDVSSVVKSELPAALAVGVGLLLVLRGDAPLPALAGLPLLLAGLAWALWPPPERLLALWQGLVSRRSLSWGLPLAGLALLVCLVYWPLAQGHMPWAAGQADHPTHLYQAWLLVERLIPSGRLSGWSDMRWAGYPALELYPIGGALWVALFRLVTFGALRWEATYALAILGMAVLNVLSTYIATRRLAGPVAALVAALLVLFERGWPRQGGDHYAIDVGVWPVTLGIGPLLLCLERAWTWIASPAGGPRSGRALAAAAALAGWALLCHPLYLPLLALALPTVAAVAALSGERPWRAVTGSLVVGLVGFGLSAFWYLPFLETRYLSEPGGAPFRSLANLGEGLVMGTALPSFWPLAAVLGLVGLLVALRRGGAPAAVAALALVLLLAASATPLELSDRLSRMAGSLQQERFLIVVRVLLCVLSGFAVALLFAAARPRKEGGEARDRLGHRSRVAAALVAALVGTLAWPAAQGLLKHQVAPVVEFEHGPDLAHRRDLLALCTWMREEVARRGDRFVPRTAWYVGYGRHEHTAAPVFCGLPQVVDTPAETWASRPGGISEREVRAFGVLWVVGDRPVEGRGSYLRLVRTFGRLHVYEVRDYRYERVTSLGGARVELLSFEDERIRVRISGASRGDRVAVHVARHPGWQASLDGAPLRITGGHLGLPRADLIHVPVPSDGVLELRYVRSAAHARGALLTLACLLALVALGLSGRLAPRFLNHTLAVRTLHAWARLPAAVRVATGVLLTGLLVLGPAAIGSGRRDEAAEEPRPEGIRLADRLGDAQVWIARQGVVEVVPRRWDGRFGYILPPRVVADRHVEAIELGDSRRVLAVRPLEGEAVRVRVDVGPTRGVVGWLARGGRGRSETRVEVLVGGRPIGRAVAEELGAWAPVDLRSDDPPGAPLDLVVRAEGVPSRAVLLDLVAQ